MSTNRYVVEWKESLPPEVSEELIELRDECYTHGIIGYDKKRYPKPYGNISKRLNNPSEYPVFLLTASGTSGKKLSTKDDFVKVNADPERYNIERKIFIARGPKRPSIEGYLHACIQDLDPMTDIIVHGHCPNSFENRAGINIPIIYAYSDDIQVVRQIRELRENDEAWKMGVFRFDENHPDGFFAWDNSFNSLMSKIFDYIITTSSREPFICPGPTGG